MKLLIAMSLILTSYMGSIEYFDYQHRKECRLEEDKMLRSPTIKRVKALSKKCWSQAISF